MRLEPQEPANESQFYQRVRSLTASQWHWERIEPANESGFPDTYFTRLGGGEEGTVEFKFSRTKGVAPRLKPLLRGNQMASLIEYFAAGGRRRYALCYHVGYSYFYDTEAFYRAALGKPSQSEWTSSMDMNDPAQFRSWLTEMLTNAKV